ncbi:hypothetical protein N752_03015 [Desulforamulus aquiferis]|nr:precorrin-8X methylmutase [Desulforamulus aquiferis]RYD06658.1 hypothetical protein N752_03015 [Desulforamulus aquiferis]
MSNYQGIIWNPREIEQESMRQVEEFCLRLNLATGERAVVGRIIHTSGDPELGNQVCIHPKAIERGLEALRGGAHIYTDVTMLKAGINQRKLAVYGGEIRCEIYNPEVAEEARARGITRAAVAMEKFGNDLNGQLVAIGNAPTALFRLLQMIDQGLSPALVIGMPVGFVGAAQSKEMLMKSRIPYITVLGTRGGSPLAAATVNALLYLQD